MLFQRFGDIPTMPDAASLRSAAGSTVILSHMSGAVR